MMVIKLIPLIFTSSLKKSFILSIFMLMILTAIFSQSTDLNPLNLTAEERSWVEQNPLIKVAATPDWPPFEYREGDSYLGLHADILRLVALKAGLEIEPVFDQWSILQDKLKRGELDLCPGLNATDLRKEFLIFTDPLSETSQVIITQTADELTSIGDLFGRTVAVEKGYANEIFLRENYPDINLLTLDSTLQAIKSVITGKADAYIGTQAVSLYLIKKHRFINLHVAAFLEEAKPSIYRMGVIKSKPLLRDILEKGLKAITREEMVVIENLWFGNLELSALDTPSDIESLKLTEDEKNWIKTHRIIKFSGDDYPPFEIISDNNTYSGLASDYIKIIEKRLGITFDYMPGLTWTETVARLKKGTIDFVPVISPTWKRRKEILFTETYIDFPQVIVTRTDYPPVSSIRDFSGKTLVVSRGYSEVEELEEFFPAINLNIVNNPLEELGAVAIGQADGAQGSLAVFTYLIDKHHLLNLQISAPSEIEGGAMAMGVRQDWPELVSIIDKVLNSMSEYEKTSINNKWSGRGEDFWTQLRTFLKWVIPVIFVVLIIIALIIIRNRRMAKEIQKRTQMETELVKLNQTQVFAAETARLAYVEVNLEKHELTVNDQFYQLVDSSADVEGGYSMTLEHYFEKYVHPNDRNFITGIIGNAIKSTADFTDQFEFRINTKNALLLYVFVKYNVQHNLKGEAIEIRGIMLDITERKNLENELKLTKFGIDNAGDSVWWIKPDTAMITHANETAWKSLGYSKEEFINKTIPQIDPVFPPERWPLLVASLQETDSLTFESMHKKKDGEIFPIEINARYFKFEDNPYIVAFSRDISTRKQAEEDLKKAKESAEDATKAKGDFLANMSHEIRTPMNAIIGLNHLLSRTGLNNKQKDYVKKVSYSAKGLLGIINDILDFSKIEAGKMEIEKIDFELNDIFDNLMNLISEKVREKGLELLFDINGDVPPAINGDSLRIGQIVLNFVSNALKFTEKGEIRISCSLISRENDMVTLKFAVTDTGLGLSQEQQNKLFSAFTQADTSTTRKFGGTGLGLSISKRLAELMGGTVGVSSELGVGSTFYFTVTSEIVNSIKPRELIIPTEIHDLNVLVVDDNQSARELLREYLLSFKYNVKTVNKGLEALEELEHNSFDLILMDYLMPGMNGVETSREIRKLKLKTDPKIILVTSYSREDIIKEIEDFSFDGILLKPVVPSLLFDTIMDSFNQHIYNNEQVSISQEISSHVLDAVRGASILLVEDNAINQQVAVELLETEGFKVDVADDGKIACGKIIANSYELVFMDLQMPVMDGIEATEIIRKNKDFSDLPIIAMTADAMTGIEEKVKKAGMNDYITKPIDLGQLWNCLSLWIKPGERALPAGYVLKEKPDKNDIFPPIDGIDTKSGLARVGNNAKLYRNLLKQFTHDYSDISSLIGELQNSGQEEAAVREAHSIKGVSANLGAEELQNLMAEIERRLKESEDLGNSLVLADDTFKKLVDAIEISGVLREEGTIKIEREKISAEIFDSMLQNAIDSLLKRKPKPAIQILEKLLMFDLSQEIKDPIDQAKKYLGKYKMFEAKGVLEKVLDSEKKKELLNNLPL